MIIESGSGAGDTNEDRLGFEQSDLVIFYERLFLKVM